MKVIFLDIDGVMNSNVLYEEKSRTLGFKLRTLKWKIKKLFVKPKAVSLANYVRPDSHYTFNYLYERLIESSCPKKWKWLSEFCNETDTKICVSSTWRFSFRDKQGLRLDWWADALSKLGFKEDTFIGITTDRMGDRGEEIQEFLDEHEEIENYVILDDDSDMLSHQFKYFHHVDSYYGLSPNHLYRIGRQFKGLSNYKSQTHALQNN